MELHQLRYFAAVAELGNFTRAAEKCFVAQPSLSQQVIKLERELGAPLFERLGRRVKLTDAGRALYRQAVAILAAVEEAKRRVADGADPAHGRLAVGAIPTVAPYLLPPLLQGFLARFPGAEVMVYEDLTEHTVRRCVQGELDVGLLALPVRHERLASETLYSEELLLAVPAGHPLARKRRVTMADVGRERFILLDETHCLGEQIVRFCAERACLPAVSCHSAQLLTVQELVGLGHGVSLIPEMAAAADRDARRVYRSLSGARPRRTLAAVWHKHAYHGPLVRHFLAALREHAGRVAKQRRRRGGGAIDRG
ncbi:MAG TPA: LysR substrate-binding domain-containing protein [Gemmataceae bacterium]